MTTTYFLSAEGTLDTIGSTSEGTDRPTCRTRGRWQTIGKYQHEQRLPVRKARATRSLRGSPLLFLRSSQRVTPSRLSASRDSSPARTSAPPSRCGTNPHPTSAAMLVPRAARRWRETGIFPTVGSGCRVSPASSRITGWRRFRNVLLVSILRAIFFRHDRCVFASSRRAGGILDGFRHGDGRTRRA